MEKISVRMFGKLEVRSGDLVWGGPENGKARELFCYLLAHSRASFTREQIAAQLWPECDSCHSKKNLRQVLWRLQAESDDALTLLGQRLVLTRAERLSVNPEFDLGIDVFAFEEAFAAMRKGAYPLEELLPLLRDAVDAYQDEFLSGCYQDWCIFERERLQSMLLAMLDRLTGACLDQRAHEAGIRYGQRLLEYDPASERTHRNLMRIHSQAGDRSAAIRQYERCVRVLQEELGVAPEASTTRLYEDLRAVSPGSLPVPPASTPTKSETGNVSLPEILSHLQRVQAFLADMEQQISRDIQIVRDLLPRQEKNS